MEDILDQFPLLSRGNKFHAMLATSSIPEAINYYRLFKERAPQMHVTALFDPNVDNSNGAILKGDALQEIIGDYNELFGKDFIIPTWPKMKKDITARLSHKRPYLTVDQHREERIDLLIVVDQMLTGFDSKWVNTLYLDKIIDYENIIQAFSVRTDCSALISLRNDTLLSQAAYHERVYRSSGETVFRRQAT